MAAVLQTWRKRHRLTQVDAASLLGVSQPYLSLLEKGHRPLTAALRERMKVACRDDQSNDEGFRIQLAALGYRGFAHLKRPRVRTNPAVLLLSVLGAPDADARVVDALPWVVRRHADEMDFDWMTRQAKLRNLQNRLGFVLQLSGVETSAVLTAVRELDRARLLQEDTLCWDSMPAATREWMRANRSQLAEHWNVLTRLQSEDVPGAA